METPYFLFHPFGSWPAGFLYGTPFALPFGVCPPPFVFVMVPAETLSSWASVSFTGSEKATVEADPNAPSSASVDRLFLISFLQTASDIKTTAQAPYEITETCVSAYGHEASGHVPVHQSDVSVP